MSIYDNIIAGDNIKHREAENITRSENEEHKVVDDSTEELFTEITAGELKVPEMNIEHLGNTDNTISILIV